MPSIDIRHLRNPHRLKALLGKGETVELREGHRLIALIVPTRQPYLRPLDLENWPDFRRRRRRIFGERILSGSGLVVAERGRY
jgi:antitoxin (DNA-binding transcriptional repressor) of toxin-antitoxin stability system